MKRELKFRAYSNETLKMMDWAFIKSVGNLTKLICLNHVDVMQFTGQKDKNGKEIYEGDFDEDYQVVMWCENSCGWQWATYDFPTKEKICCHCYNCEGDYNFTEQIEKVEIQGNIYENAEAATS